MSMPSRRSDASHASRTYAGVAADRRVVGVVADRADAELRRDDHLVAPAPDRAADQLLVGERAVHVGGVEERHAEVERPVDRRDRLVVVARRRRTRSCPCSRGRAETVRPERPRVRGGDGRHEVLFRSRSILKLMAPRQSLRRSRSCRTCLRCSSRTEGARSVLGPRRMSSTYSCMRVMGMPGRTQLAQEIDPSEVPFAVDPAPALVTADRIDEPDAFVYRRVWGETPVRSAVAAIERLVTPSDRTP